ncbi:MAG: Coproporphyrinogen oxidase [Bacteroidetes bacterium]|jgi:coproporphyrinogen III oxidase|nr:Coproporphyrinogen oxidase [Bacteroidota bacterium]
MSFKDEITGWLMQLQDSICASLEQADGTSVFTEDKWTREEGGGGRSRIIADGAVIEKGGVGFSAVHGPTPAFLTKEDEHAVSSGISSGSTFFATGVSIVIHPQSPMVPIIHMNIRYFETSDGVKWLGGGIDLTPHYVSREDARFFHEALKKVCDSHDPAYYPKFKTWADDYFYIPHRKETRGIGGIFFDRITSGDPIVFQKQVAFWKEVGETFVPVYTELIRRNKEKVFGEKEKNWQLLRRGRYVEFNLVYDKGTKFGLETNGRIESILMSLPKYASWQYNFIPEEGSEEAKTLLLLKKGQDFLT